MTLSCEAPLYRNGSDTAPHPRGRRRRVALIAFVFLLASLGGFLTGGFLRFTQEVSAFGMADHQGRAEGIVVLTGGSSRIDQAIDLLKNGNAERLLISGVNRSTSIAALARLTSTDRQWFDCCVDLDYAALNTIGNAEMASRWARLWGFEEVILVTSDYHMPRSLIEFERISPLRRVVPFAVRRGDLWAGEAIPSLSGLKVLLTEYAKLMVTRVRFGLVEGDLLDSEIAELDMTVTRTIVPRPQ